MSSYWVTDSLSRTRKDGAAGSTRAITLYLGRRETRSCQLNIRATSSNSRVVRVTADDGLTVALFKEHYVNLTTGSAQSSYYDNHGEGPGYWPDGLTPLDSGDSVFCTVSINQSIWVDITAPPDFPAGTKTVTISWSGTTYTITVIVGDFSLPERPVMGSLFRYLNVDNDLGANALLREHRLLPMYNTVADSRNQDWVSCSFYSSINRSTCQAVTAAPTSGAVATKKALYAPLPSGTTLYSYTFDEPGACADNAGLQATAADYYAALNANSVKMLVTMAPHDDWDYANMIPVVLPKLYVKADVDAWVAASRIIWSYNCLNQDKYSPKWLLDMAPLQYRIFGFLNQILGFSGMLYWACDDWSEDPWNDVELAKWGTTKPGEGMLVYPATGTPDGDFPGTVLPSMRLKQLRDASQDYDLVWLCEQASLSAEAAAAIADVGTAYTWGNWTTDKDVIIAAQVALEVLLSPGDDPPPPPPPPPPPTTPPTAAFHADIVSGQRPLAVTFTDETASLLTILSWAWTFGDGGSSNEQNPSHTYTAAATYNVALTATNADGPDTETKTGYIAVSPVLPTAAFSSVPVTGTAPLTVQFTDSSVNAASWAWDFGDTETSTDQSPSHEYAAAGTYTVRLVATNDDGNDSETKAGYIVVSVAVLPAVADFTRTPISGEPPLTVAFTDASTNATSWAWDFGDGDTSTDQNPTHVYAADGRYTVTLVASNATDSDTLVMLDGVVVQTVVPPATALVASFSFDQPASGLVPISVAFTDTSTGDPVTWAWDFGDGQASDEQSPTHSYNLRGTRTLTVKLTVTNEGGDMSSAQSRVTIRGRYKDRVRRSRRQSWE